MTWFILYEDMGATDMVVEELTMWSEIESSMPSEWKYEYEYKCQYRYEYEY